jgi:hypothetical protein
MDYHNWRKSSHHRHPRELHLHRVPRHDLLSARRASSSQTSRPSSPPPALSYPRGIGTVLPSGHILYAASATDTNVHQALTNVHQALRSGSATSVQPGSGCTFRARLAALSPLETDASAAVDLLPGTGEYKYVVWLPARARETLASRIITWMDDSTARKALSTSSPTATVRILMLTAIEQHIRDSMIGDAAVPPSSVSTWPARCSLARPSPHVPEAPPSPSSASGTHARSTPRSSPTMTARARSTRSSQSEFLHRVESTSSTAPTSRTSSRSTPPPAPAAQPRTARLHPTRSASTLPSSTSPTPYTPTTPSSANGRVKP